MGVNKKKGAYRPAVALPQVKRIIDEQWHRNNFETFCFIILLVHSSDSRQRRLLDQRILNLPHLSGPF